jgi:hypothetical protein
VNRKFVVGIDRAKMRLYDVENSAQMDIIDSGQETPVFEKGNFNNRDKFKKLKVM